MDSTEEKERKAWDKGRRLKAFLRRGALTDPTARREFEARYEHAPEHQTLDELYQAASSEEDFLRINGLSALPTYRTPK